MKINMNNVGSDISPCLTHNSNGGSRKRWAGGIGPSSFGRQQGLSEITIETIKNGGLGNIWGLCLLAPT